MLLCSLSIQQFRMIHCRFTPCRMLFQQNVAFGWCMCAMWVQYYHVRCRSKVIKRPENEWEQSCKGIYLSTAHWQPGPVDKHKEAYSVEIQQDLAQWPPVSERQGERDGKDFILLFLAGARHCPGHGKSQNTFLTAPSEPNRHCFTWNPSVRLCGCFVTTVPMGEIWAAGVFQGQPPVGPQKGPCIISAFQVASALVVGYKEITILSLQGIW